MAERTLLVLECDRCGRPGAHRFEVIFPDGKRLQLDRCDTHGRKIEVLRNEPGKWLEDQKARRTHFQVIDEDTLKDVVENYRDGSRP